MNRLGTMGEQVASLVHEITQPIATARNDARAALNFPDRQPPELGEVRDAVASVVGDAGRAGEIIDRIRDPRSWPVCDLPKCLREVGYGCEADSICSLRA